MTFVEYINEPSLQEPPLTHPYPMPAVWPQSRGGRREIHYHFVKAFADVRKFPALSDGVEEREKSGQCSVDTPCPFTAQTDVRRGY